MSVKIRLSRLGKNKVPFYRIVATDSRNKRDGAALDNLGTYDPLKGVILSFNQERMDYWVSVGAQVTDAVKRLQKKYRKVGAQNTAKVATVEAAS